MIAMPKRSRQPIILGGVFSYRAERLTTLRTGSDVDDSRADEDKGADQTAPVLLQPAALGFAFATICTP